MYSPGLKDSLSTGNATIGKVKIVDNNNNVINSETDINGDYYLNVNFIQDVHVDTNNSTTTNLNAGLYYTGTATSTLGVNAIQVSLKTDINCHIYVEQSPNGINWDISDEYDYYYSLNNFGVTVQAINSYIRVRVHNYGMTNSTYFRLQTVLCPDANPLPRSLDKNGHLLTAIHSMVDEYGFEVEHTPNGEMRIVQPTLLVGKIFEGTILDSNFWTATVANNGTVTIANSDCTLSTNTTSANGSAILTSVRRARYVPGQAHVARLQVVLGTPATANNNRKWGVGWGATMPTISDGAYFEVEGSTFEVVVLKGGVATKITNGNFNGTYGSTYDPGTTIHTYEVYWNTRDLFFTIDGEVLHTMEVSTITLTNTVQFHIYLENTNINNLQTNQTLLSSAAGIRRLGPLLSQPTSKYQSGTTAGLILKYGAGNVHGISISGIINNSVVTLYDNTAASGTILWSSGAMTNQTVPLSIDLKGLPFYTGLTLVISSANSNATIIYE